MWLKYMFISECISYNWVYLYMIHIYIYMYKNISNNDKCIAIDHNLIRNSHLYVETNELKKSVNWFGYKWWLEIQNRNFIAIGSE